MDSVLFPCFQNQLYESLVSTTRAVIIVGSHDIDFYRSLDPDFALLFTSCNKRLLDLMNSLIQLVSSGKSGKIDDYEDLNYKWWDIVDVVDSLLEKTSSHETDGGILKDSKKKKLSYKFIHAENVLRPQLRFSTAPDNNPDTPWKRKITVKPNALVPLNSCISENNDIWSKTNIALHPYEYEINNIKYSEELFKGKKPIDPIPFNDSKAIWVNTVQLLEDMVKNLKNATEIAVDLEHHDYRSYQGFVCLMQISTRNIDWIVDTLELREELEILNEVLHGASMDIIWLQRDFGLYIVGLFDTYHATRVLGFEGHSLAFLLKKYVNFDSDKRYQLADWRIRPLPEEMLSYARSDTHFLLYIYDQLKNELLLKSTLSHNLLLLVLSASNNVALKVFEKDKYDIDGFGVDGWKNILQKWSNCLTSELQVSVLISLHQWRDKIARQEDESVRYVLPNQTLVQIAVNCPDNAASVLSICNHIPPLVRVYVDEIVQIIQSTKRDKLKKISSLSNLEVPPRDLCFSKNSDMMKDTNFIDCDRLFQNDIINTKLMYLVAKSSVFWNETIENYGIKYTKIAAIKNILKDMRLIVQLPLLSDKVLLDKDLDNYISMNKDDIIVEKNDLIHNTSIDKSDSGISFYHSFTKRNIDQLLDNQKDDILIVKKLGKKQKRFFDVSENKYNVIEENNDFLSTYDKSLLLLGDFNGSKEKKKKKSNKRAKLLGNITECSENLKPYDYEKEPSFFNKLHDNYRLKESIELYENNLDSEVEERFKQPKCENAPRSGLRSMVFGK
ncbi:hypothetical protein PMAC_001021 [Pneumocystis sp. 'macacae']|nr:hypothetical protein PMAC_001021 [Pneumocystis sp. 'macacae']